MDGGHRFHDHVFLGNGEPDRGTDQFGSGRDVLQQRIRRNSRRSAFLTHVTEKRKGENFLVRRQPGGRTFQCRFQVTFIENVLRPENEPDVAGHLSDRDGEMNVVRPPL